MWDDVIELYLVISHILATDAADLTIAPYDLQQYVARNRAADAPVFSGFSKRLGRKENRADVAKDATPQFVCSIFRDPRPALRLQAQDSLDCSVYLRVFLEIPRTNRIHQFCVTFPDLPYRELIRHQRKVLNKRAIGTVF